MSDFVNTDSICIYNRKLIDDSGITYLKVSSHSLFYLRIKMEGKPKVHFFPKTGKWICWLGPNSSIITKNGGAEKFLKWYEKL